MATLKHVWQLIQHDDYAFSTDLQDAYLNVPIVKHHRHFLHSFLCSLLVRLGLHINFSKSDLHLSQTFTFLGLCWDTICMSVSLPPDKLADIQQLALSLL